MSKTRALIVTAWMLAGLIAMPAVAASASFSVIFTNQGQPLPDPSEGRFYIYEEGKRERYLTWGNAARSARIEAGTYDIVIRYINDTIVEERVLESFPLKGDVVREVAFEISPAHLTIEITAGGVPIHVHSGSYDVHVAGRRGKPMAARRPGERLTLRPGRYDIEVRYRDPQGLQSTWLTDYLVTDEHLETVDIGVASARLLVSMTYRDVPVMPGQGEWEIHRPGDPHPLTGGASGERVELPAGIYDLRVLHEGLEEMPLERWIRGIEVDGDTRRIVELREGPDTDLRVLVRRAGEPLVDAWYSVYPVGQTLTPLATARSGDRVEVHAGRYDIHCTYRKGAIRAEQWVRDEAIEGSTELEVDLPLSTATLTVRPPRRIRKPVNRSGVMILLDSSLAMGEPMDSRSRMELVQRTLGDTLEGLVDDTMDVGVRVWGVAPQSLGNCRDSTLLVPLTEFDSSGMERALGLIRPSGFAPIAYSLLQAASDLPTGDRTTILVITAGTDDCSGDPCDAAARLIKRGRADRVHVIGLDQPRHAETELACIGTYHSASNRAQLRNALRSVFRESSGPDRGRVSVFLPGRNRWIASAELGQSIQLLEGRYDLLIRAGNKTYHWNDFEVRGNKDVTAGPRR